MKKHHARGFTIVELITVIVIVAILATITSIAYRETQKNARDKKRQADVLMLKSAIEEYYADNGTYPRLTTCEYSSGTECWGGQAWNLLKNEGYLTKIPMPDISTSHHTSGLYINSAPGGKAYYAYWSTPTITKPNYAIYVPLESGDCKVEKNSLSTWWSSVEICEF